MAISKKLSQLASLTTVNGTAVTIAGTLNVPLADSPTFTGTVSGVTKAMVGLPNVEDKNSSTIRSELSHSNVSTALGFTPYNATNPNGYTTNVGTLTAVTATGPIASTGGTTPVISMPAATTTVDGHLTAADWTIFNNKQVAGTYATGTGTAAGTNTGDNAINSLYSGLVSNATHTGDVTGSTALTLATVNTNVGQFGSTTAIPVVTVNGKGLITAISTTSITVPTLVSQLSNDSSFATTTYVGTAIANLVASSPAALDTLNELAAALGNDASFAATTATNLGLKALKTTTISAGAGLTGGGDLGADRTLALTASGVTAGTYNNVTVDTYGRATSGSNVAYITGYTEVDTLATVTARGSQASASITIGSNGTYAAGSIYSDSNWGMLFRARQASPASKEFMWSTSTDTNLMTLSTAGALNAIGAITGSNLSGTNTGDNPGVTSVAGVTPIVSSGGTTPSISHATSGATAGTYNNVTVDTFGHVTSGSNTAYITGYSETDTLATVTARGATTSTASTFSGGITGAINGMPNDGNGLSGMGVSTTWDARPQGVYDRYSLNWHTGISLSGYPGYGGVRLYASGYPSITTSTLRLEASDAVYTYGVLYNNGNTVLHAANYNSYSPTLTGGSASGTWGINVTGTSNNITAYTINQNLGTGYGPTFANVYNDGWFRTNASGNGMYNQTTGQHWYSDSTKYWNMGGGNVNGQGIRFRDTHAGTVRGYIHYDQSNNIGFLNQNETWKLRVVDGDYTLVEGSSMRAPIFYDSNDTAYYVDPNSTTTSISIAGAIEQGNNLARPLARWDAAGSATGMVIFYLPGTTGNYGMVHMIFDIYEYNGTNVSTVTVGGHNWGGSTWHQYGAQINGTTNKEVRVGIKDGQYCVVFGSAGSSWSYGQIVLRKIQNGQYYNDAMNLGGAYTASITTTDSFTWVSGDLRKFASSGSISSTADIRAPIFYDSDNTAYYVDAAGESRLNSLRIFGAANWDAITLSTDGANGYIQGLGDETGLHIRSEYGNVYLADNRGDVRMPMFYDVNDTAYYVDPNSGSNLSSLTVVNTITGSISGTAASETLATVTGRGASTSAAISLSGTLSFAQPVGLSFANGQYIKDNGGGGLSIYSGAAINLTGATAVTGALTVSTTVQTTGKVVIGGTFATTGYNGPTGARLMFSGADTDAESHYFIGTNLENYGGNYNKLDIRWHTGIRMGARSNYGGIRFYDSEDLGTQIFAIGKDGSYAQANHSMRAPIFYDHDDTTYYGDFASTSNLLGLTVTNTITGSVTGTATELLSKYPYNTNVISDANTAFTLSPGVGSTTVAMHASHGLFGGYATTLTMSGYERYGAYQISGNYNATTSALAMRNYNQTAGGWTSWVPLLSSANYNSYSPTLTGGGASGTWGISITGNSATTSQTAFSDLSIVGAGHKYLYINPGNGYEAMVRYNGGSGSGWYVGKRTAVSLVGSESFHLYSEAAGATVGGIDPSGNMFASGSMRAPIFYDNNDTAYFVDPASSSFINSLSVNVGQESTGAANSSSAGLVLRGSYNSNTWAHKFHKYDNGSGLPMWLSYTAGTGAWTAAQGWGPGLSYTSQVYGSFRANDTYGTIFYDADDTSYYLNPNSSSRLSSLTTVGNITSPRFIGNTAWGSANLSDLSSAPFEGGYFGVGTTAKYVPLTHQYTGYDSGYQTHVSTGTYKDANGWGGGWYMAIGGSDSYPTEAFQLRHGGAIRHTNGYVTIEGDTRSPTFYDSNDTGYYVNPNSVSNLYGLTLAGGSYFKPSNWIQFDSAYGLYWPNNNAAHIHGNDISSYGSIAIRGVRNGWRGIYFHEGGYTPHYMLDGSGNGGLYHESSGRWANYYNYSNDCTGFGTSSTSSTFNVYATKGVYGGARVDASYFYDAENTAYYADPAGTSKFDSLRLTSASPLYFSTTSTAELLHESDATPVAFAMRKGGGSLADGTAFGVLNLRRTNHNQAAATAGASLFFELKDDGATLREYAGITGRKTVSGASGGQLDFHNYGRNVVAWTNVSELTHSSSVRAPIFYDSDNTYYYADLNATSNLLNITLNGKVNLPSGASGTTFGASHYSMGKDYADGGWTGPHYSDLIIGYHTGIRIGATYTGIRFYNNSPTTDGNNDGNGDGGEALLMTVGGHAGSNVNVIVNNTFTALGDARAPIFYDSDDTGYYTNPASTSDTAQRMRGGTVYGPNVTWGAYLLVGGDGRQNYTNTAYASVCTTNGNLHLDSGTAAATHINWYDGTDLLVGAGDSATLRFKVYGVDNYSYASGSMRAPIFYDNDNTAYYLDAAGTSVFNRISTVRTDNFLYMDNNYGHSIVGAYSASRYQGVFAMGDAYKLPADGATTGSLYGLAWSHPNAGGVAANLNTHGLLAMENGTWLASLCGSTRARDDMRAPIFYDNNNTAYYLDPNTTGTSLNVAGSITAGGNITASSDIRLKEDIEVITDAIDKVKQITGVTYTRKENGKRQTGVIAQDVLKVLPEAVEGSDDSMYSVAYGNMVGLLIESIKEQQKTIESLTARIAVLEAK